MARRREDWPTRFWQKVQRCAHGATCARCCWEWQAARFPKGYGHFVLPRKQRVTQSGYAHRIAWELTYGTLLPGIFVLHKCDNPPCVNPTHLWLGTPGDNMRDRDRKGRGRKGRGRQPPRGCVLTAQQVQEIRGLLATPSLTQREIARRYGVSRTTILCVAHGYTWAWLPEAEAYHE